MQRRKIEHAELVNLLVNLGEDYFEIEKEKGFGIMGMSNYGKVLIIPQEKGMKINLDFYSKVTYCRESDGHGGNYYPRAKKKIKSLEGFIEYPKLRL